MFLIFWGALLRLWEGGVSFLPFAILTTGLTLSSEKSRWVIYCQGRAPERVVLEESRLRSEGLVTDAASNTNIDSPVWSPSCSHQGFSMLNYPCEVFFFLSKSGCYCSLLPSCPKTNLKSCSFYLHQQSCVPYTHKMVPRSPRHTCSLFLRLLAW